MARTSRRFEEKKNEAKEKVLYKAGIYTRLSHERTESWRDKSQSIETQTLKCKEYALKENIQVMDVFTDYEYSGTNFERPEFQNMMEAVKNRKINCIIIRDLSRLGREYLEMGRLIDKVFPFLGVRFISVDDNLDTIKEVDHSKSFEVTIKNIINDMYAKDISVKIKTSKMNRAKRGYFIGSNPSFGYKVIKEREGQKLEIDERVRFIIDEIFDLTLQGKTQIEVAKHLNQRGYATPKVYYKLGKIYRDEADPLWTASSIGKILSNQVYIGDLVQGVKTQYLAEGKKQTRADKKDYIIFENAHEAIIERDIFWRIQKERKERKANHVFSSKPHDFERDPENRFKGMIFYVKTGEQLYRRTRIDGSPNKKVLKYLFRNERFDGDHRTKKSIFIMENDLDERIVKDIAEVVQAMTSRKSFSEKIAVKYAKSIEQCQERIKTLDKKIYKEEHALQKSYEMYSLGQIDRETFLLKRDVTQGHIETLEREKIAQDNVILKLKQDRDKARKWIKDLFSTKGLERLPSELIESLVEKVLVHDTHDFEVIYKFNRESLMEGKYE